MAQNGIALDFESRYFAGSNPASPANAPIAQWSERWAFNPRVGGSNPPRYTNTNRTRKVLANRRRLWYVIDNNVRVKLMWKKHWIPNPEVAGSNPSTLANYK